MQKSYTGKRELKRQLYTTSCLKIKTFRSRRSISTVGDFPVNEDFSFSVDDKLK